MSRSTLLLPLALAAAGCFGQVWAEGSALFPAETEADTDTDATTTTATTSAPGEGPDEPIQTATGEPPDETTGPIGSSTTLPDPVETPPQILAFTVEPDTLHEAGDAQVSALVSEDTVALQLLVDGEEVWAGPPEAFAWSFAATSQAASEGTYTLELIARDGEGLSASATAMLWVSLPPTGAEKCAKDLGAGLLTAARYTDEALIVVGTLAGAATVWRLDPDNCQPQAGFPWTIAQWTALQQALPASQAVGVAVDADGRMAIAANVGTGLARQPYLAVLSPAGALQWERLGPQKQTYSGIAAAEDRFVVIGETLVGEEPTRFDGLVESFDAKGTMLWSDVLAAPLPGDDFVDNTNKLDEHPRAISWDEGRQALVIVGERRVEKSPPTEWTRAFSAQYTLNGAIVGSWTSKGLEGDEDGLFAVARCGASHVAGGWVRTGPNSHAPVTRWLDAQGNGDKRRLDNLANARIQGIACDRELKITAAAVSNSAAHSLVFKGSDDSFADNELFEDATLMAVDCDARGFCAAVGLQGDQAWVRVQHP